MKDKTSISDLAQLYEEKSGFIADYVSDDDMKKAVNNIVPMSYTKDFTEWLVALVDNLKCCGNCKNYVNEHCFIRCNCLDGSDRCKKWEWNGLVMEDTFDKEKWSEALKTEVDKLGHPLEDEDDEE